MKKRALPKFFQNPGLKKGRLDETGPKSAAAVSKTFFTKFPFPAPAVLLLAFVFSCGSVPVPEAEIPPEETEQSLPAPGEAETPGEESSGENAEFAGDEVPEDVPVPEDSGVPETIMPPETPAESRPELPEPEFPVFDIPADEIPDLPLLPEPEFPVEEDPPPPEPVPPEEPEPVEPPEPPGESVPPGPGPEPELPEQPPPPPERREPPEPPSFLRPAEPEISRPPREPVPMPPNPLPDLPARPVPETAGEKIAFSRTIRATTGQLIEIPFRGTGWVYLGELGNRRGLGYESRRLDLAGGVTEGQSFIFRAELAGTYILKFYKRDFIQDYIINDHVQVIVGEGPDYGQGAFPPAPGRVVAEPRWPPAGNNIAEVPAPDNAPAGMDGAAASGNGGGPEAGEPVSADAGEPETASPADSPEEAGNPPLPAGTPEALAGQTATAESPAPDRSAVPSAGKEGLNETSPPEEYLRLARAEFDAGRIEGALEILDAMKSRFPLGTDEAWWLYGQLLEANTPSRDILLALEYYRRLVREYPQSSRADDARRRAAYLERYYFNIK